MHTIPYDNDFSSAINTALVLLWIILAHYILDYILILIADILMQIIYFKILYTTICEFYIISK